MSTFVVAFCRFARANGLSTGVLQTLTALEIATVIGVADRRVFAFALRAVLCSSKEEWDLFDQLFEAFCGPSRLAPKSPAGEGEEPSKPGMRTTKAGSRLGISQPSRDASSQPGEGTIVSGASAQQRLTTVDFSEVPQHDLAALEQVSLRLLRRMSLRLSRRLKIKNLADRVDLRRTIRRSIAQGGDPMFLAHKRKKPRQNRLVIFLDISGSMSSYSLFLVRFAYALQKHLKRVDTFLFSTSVVEITDALRASHLPDALRRLSQRTADWAGGTKIGASLQDFNRLHGRKLLSRDTVLMILSDGWDTGEPEVLAEELRTAKSRVQRLIWLNPLLGLKDYQPITRGMSAALPYVDVFAPAHNLESLLTLEKYL